MPILTRLILIVIFVAFVIAILYDGNKLSKKLCHQILNEAHFGIVKKKIKDMNNHGHIDIYYVDTISYSEGVLAPDPTGEGLTLYNKIEIGDTIKKESGLGAFYILNYPKKDSVIFHCND
jgi:hypothetical protein